MARVQKIELSTITMNDTYFTHCFLFADNEDPLVSEGHRIKSDFFRREVVKEICERLISHYLPLTPEDLALWDSDPEEYSK